MRGAWVDVFVAAAAAPAAAAAEEEDLVEDLVDTMHAANGAGIAAPQIDEPWRVFVVHGTGDNPRYPYKPAVPLTVFVNPVIEVLDDTPPPVPDIIPAILTNPRS